VVMGGKGKKEKARSWEGTTESTEGGESQKIVQELSSKGATGSLGGGGKSTPKLT